MHKRKEGKHLSFSATRFEFANKSSEDYSLTISSFGSGEDTTVMPGGVKLYTEKIFRRTSEYLLGTDITPMLEFPIQLTTDNGELSAVDLQTIGAWLFERTNYEDLKIMQPDMTSVKYRCFFLDPKIIRVGNKIVGVSATVHCQDAWATGEEKTFTYTGVGSFVHNNSSDNNNYTYPITIITANAFGGTLTITNTSDANRITQFTTIAANEVLTIDNSRQTITSSTLLRRMSNFNKKFFRLKRGINNLTISGNIASVVIKYANARKIGG